MMISVRSGWGRILIGFPVETVLFSEPSTSAPPPTKSLMQRATGTKLILHWMSRFRNNGTSPLSRVLLWHGSSVRSATTSTTIHKFKEPDRSAPPHKTRNLLNKVSYFTPFDILMIYLREVRSVCRCLCYKCLHWERFSLPIFEKTSTFVSVF